MWGRALSGSVSLTSSSVPLATEAWWGVACVTRCAKQRTLRRCHATLWVDLTRDAYSVNHAPGPSAMKKRKRKPSGFDGPRSSCPFKAVIWEKAI